MRVQCVHASKVPSVLRSAWTRRLSMRPTERGIDCEVGRAARVGRMIAPLIFVGAPL
jgi:hypothetical protein